jgi:hypothetical protein
VERSVYPLTIVSVSFLRLAENFVSSYIMVRTSYIFIMMMMMLSSLCYANTSSRILTLLAHWNNSQRVDRHLPCLLFQYLSAVWDLDIRRGELISYLPVNSVTFVWRFCNSASEHLNHFYIFWFGTACLLVKHSIHTLLFLCILQHKKIFMLDPILSFLWSVLCILIFYVLFLLIAVLSTLRFSASNFKRFFLSSFFWGVVFV